ncbi:MAG: DUF2905 domain-containing protein [Candidatus Krumholzibacteriia bacterium]
MIVQGDPVRELGKLLLIVGILIAALGLVLAIGPKLPFRIGRLPGDIVVKREHFTFYFPLATSVLLSVLLTLVFWLLRRKP